MRVDGRHRQVQAHSSTGLGCGCNRTKSDVTNQLSIFNIEPRRLKQVARPCSLRTDDMTIISLIAIINETSKCRRVVSVLTASLQERNNARITRAHGSRARELRLSKLIICIHLHARTHVHASDGN